MSVWLQNAKAGGFEGRRRGSASEGVLANQGVIRGEAVNGVGGFHGIILFAGQNKVENRDGLIEKPDRRAA